MLKGKTVLIGITGGIAAYKICELIRMYKRANAKVRVICTKNALHLVTKTTLQSLSQNEVGVEQFQLDDFKPEHISYADEADIMVIAPATANTISKIAMGICDNLLTSVACAFRKPLLIAPAMNCNMWDSPIIQDNITKLRNLGYTVLDTENGYLACGYEGYGRLCPLDVIFDKTVSILENQKLTTPDVKLQTVKNLSSKKIIVTSGGTIEELDPVRYISNYSSGKMGLAIADVAHKRGAEVILITTKDVERDYKVVKVKSAIDMQNAIDKDFETSNCIIMAAAVADYRAKTIVENKMKKTSQDEISIELVKNPDILKSLCEKKTNQIVVGFCAETENLIENAKEKFVKKGCDFLVANDVSRAEIGFSSDDNEVVIISGNSNTKFIEKAQKKIIAEEILKEIYG